MGIDLHGLLFEIVCFNSHFAHHHESLFLRNKSMETKYVNEISTKLKLPGKRQATLIWGDPVFISEGEPQKMFARAQEGWVDPAVLGNRSLLEIYVIDVGQGDGILIKTPDSKWHLIDAGISSLDQSTGKGAANFLHWKFIRELGLSKISLANVILTHPDYDHYGGLIDILSGKLGDEGDVEVEVENFYHPGLARFKDDPCLGRFVDGLVDPFPNGAHSIQRKGTFITELLDGRESFDTPPRVLDDGFARLAKLVGKVQHNVRRISHRDKFLPGYAPGENDVVIHILGPILESFNGGTGLRRFENDSHTVNGHSVVLRLDYGKARILLAGDLNTKSQRLLLSYHSDGEFSNDVAKACHHGAEEVEQAFLKAVQARATIISSGDNEMYSHPRPALLGAAAHNGREAAGLDGKSFGPLIYSTELARSVKFVHALAAEVDTDEKPETPPEKLKLNSIQVQIRKNRPLRPLGSILMPGGLVYGLVNVRTDGTNLMCATKKEVGNDFDFKVFKAGVDVSV
jgi:beta-lactamase superfamily II metal-dependent hydrolase